MTYLPPVDGMPAPVVLSAMHNPELLAASEMAATAGASGAWPAANRALFYPIRLAQPRTYVKAWWLNGATAAGNVDVGIFTLAGTTLTRVVASTAEAQGTVSVMQVAATFTTTTLAPGLYYWSMSCSSGSTTVWRVAPSALMLRAAGCFQAATSHPLPSSVTAAAMITAYVPAFGFSENGAV